MIVIPDIHGRSFWKEAVKDKENEDIVFIGDYMDPYDYEGIDYAQAIENFREIIEFADSHENVTLLLGNHDCHYLSESINNGSRREYLNAAEIIKTFKSFKREFLMAIERTINGKQFIFSHAGISTKWLQKHPLLTNGIDFDKISIIDWVNNAWEVRDGKFISMLNDVSYRRWGMCDCGSMIWADFLDHYNDGDGKNLVGDYQIFGHTQVKEPLIFDKFADLDCRRAFIINNEGEILEMDGTPAIKVEELKKKIESNEK